MFFEIEDYVENSAGKNDFRVGPGEGGAHLPCICVVWAGEPGSSCIFEVNIDQPGMTIMISLWEDTICRQLPQSSFVLARDQRVVLKCATNILCTIGTGIILALIDRKSVV